MDQRQSRLSQADRNIRRTSSSSSEKTLCSSCGQIRLTTVNVDDELPISICEGCGHRCGVDDSMDFDTLSLLLMQNQICQVVEMSVVTCGQCGNNDVDRFTAVGFDSERSVVRVQCMDCFEVSDIPLPNWDSDGLDGSSMAEVLASTKGGGDDEEGGWSDRDGGYVEVGGGSRGNGDGEELFRCICCGNETAECFQSHFDAMIGDLTSVTCLVCDNEKVVESFFGVECGHCGNGRKELFEVSVDDYGRIARLRCFVCGKRLRLPGEAFTTKAKVPPASQASGASLGKTKISDLDEVKPGDHVAWHRCYAIWHHAIVVDVPDSGRSLTVIHYSGDVAKVDGNFAGVRLETIDVNPQTEDLYRIDYPAGDAYPAEEVIMRAGDRIGEAKYNPFTNNCEHFARYCKTGRSESGQVGTLVKRLLLMFGQAGTRAIREAAKALGKVDIEAICQRAGRVLRKAASAEARGTALVCNVASVAMEAVSFIFDAFDAYCLLQDGKISRDEFFRMLGKRGGESVGGLFGGIVTGILGQMFVSVLSTFLVGVLGYFLSGVIGRFIGAIVGKKLSSIKH